MGHVEGKHREDCFIVRGEGEPLLRPIWRFLIKSLSMSDVCCMIGVLYFESNNVHCRACTMNRIRCSDTEMYF